MALIVGCAHDVDSDSQHVCVDEVLTTVTCILFNESISPKLHLFIYFNVLLYLT